jgi:hypothetical protein
MGPEPLKPVLFPQSVFGLQQSGLGGAYLDPIMGYNPKVKSQVVVYGPCSLVGIAISI